MISSFFLLVFVLFKCFVSVWTYIWFNIFGIPSVAIAFLNTTSEYEFQCKQRARQYNFSDN